LAADCAARRMLGPDVDIEIEVYDETNTRIKPSRLARRVLAADGGLVGLVGVQSNQFPRAIDIARPLGAAGVPVVIGGFHVSGCLAMLPEIPSDIKDALAMGVTIFAGEAEGRFDGVMKDAWGRRLKPIYNYMNDLPAMEGAVYPILPPTAVTRTAGSYHKRLSEQGIPMDPDMNKYDLEHVTTGHARIVTRTMARDLPPRLGRLLHAGACRTGHAARRRLRHELGQRNVLLPVVLWLQDVGRHSSPRRRLLETDVPARPPPRLTA
ncbi:MAG: hypothetical protein ACRD8O_05730, partial [Bryobacteraceae bacterium]